MAILKRQKHQASGNFPFHIWFCARAGHYPSSRVLIGSLVVRVFFSVQRYGHGIFAVIMIINYNEGIFQFYEN